MRDPKEVTNAFATHVVGNSGGRSTETDAASIE
jgi:hypothetical protein